MVTKKVLINAEPSPPIVKKSSTWKIGDHLKCQCAIDGNFYNAKILKITNYDDGLVYRIHYMGWNSKHDEDIHEDDAKGRFGALADEAIKRTSVAFSQENKMKLRSKLSARKSVIKTSKALKKSCSVREITRPKTKTTASYQSQVPMKETYFVLTHALKEVLIKDREFLMFDTMLPKIPASIPVAEIMQKYRLWQEKEDGSKKAQRDGSKVEAMNAKITNECFRSLVYSVQDKNDLFASGLLECFDHLFSSAELLYAYEVPMYEEILCSVQRFTGATDAGKFLHDQLPMSSRFGLVYLLRMLTKFHETVLANTKLTEVEVNDVIGHVNNLVSFLDKNCASFFGGKTEYCNAPPDYLDRVKAVAVRKTAKKFQIPTYLHV